ncbi:MAG: trigger factor [Gloeomargaritaceae cyanobacterium C42_A2020_066]|nr:trigger factor [Gloeomargaritaceae cyanobacterium C42_A2020_066]
MSIAVTRTEALPASQVGLQIEIPADMVQSTYKRVVGKMLRTIQIPGFRKGKAPQPVVFQYLGSDRIKAAVVEELVEDSLKKALQESDLQFLGDPELTSDADQLLQDFDPGRPLTFTAAVDVWPTVTLGEYKGLAIEAEEVTPDLDQVDRTLERHRHERATLVPVEDRPAARGDVVVVSFTGYEALDGGRGEPIPDLTVDDWQVDLDETYGDKLIPGVAEGIVGLRPGESRDIPSQFPDDYPQAELAGRPVVFALTLQEIKAKELPELDDAFAQEISECETLAELRTLLTERQQTQSMRQTTDNIRTKLVEALLTQVTADLPKTLVEMETRQHLGETLQQLEASGVSNQAIRSLMTRETLGELVKEIRPQVEARIKRDLALLEIAEREGLTVAPEAIEAQLEDFRKKNADLDPETVQPALERNLKITQALEWLQAQAQITLVNGTTSPDPAPPASELPSSED